MSAQPQAASPAWGCPVEGRVDVIAFTGDASRGGYTTVSGRWIDRPGEGALLPAGWAARTRTATALRTE